MATLEDPALPSRATAIQTAIGLEYFTIAYNILEGVVSVVLGGLASSVALIGFGLDSFVESFSGLIVLWRFRCEAQGRGVQSTLESAGMVHPAVFEAVDLDPETYSGFAFGLGIDRIAMMRHGIDDLRLLVENDVRFLEQFPI